jgi:secreted trypsin-like serine protease
MLFLTACDSGSSHRTVQSPPDSGGEDPTSNDSGGATEPTCATTHEPGLPSGIVGGQAVDGTSPVSKGIVFLMQQYQVDNTSRTSICTATLIDTNLIITAAHCVDRSQNNVANLSVYFTYRPECDSQLGRLHQSKKSVAEVRIHPFWNPNNNLATSRGDLAMIRIYGKAPSTYHPMKLAKDFVPMTDDEKITIAGYGMTNPDYYGSFGGSVALRMAEASPITAVQKNFLIQLTDDANEFNNQSSNEMLYIDQTHGKGVCGGDSGGPSFAKNAAGDMVVTGVASFVMNPNNSNRLCAYVAAHTSTYFHKNWIETTFRQMRTAESLNETPFR